MLPVLNMLVKGHEVWSYDSLIVIMHQNFGGANLLGCHSSELERALLSYQIELGTAHLHFPC